MGSNGLHSWDFIGLGILLLSISGLLWLNWVWRKWINKK